jgi:hypothetical protein
MSKIKQATNVMNVSGKLSASAKEIARLKAGYCPVEREPIYAVPSSPVLTVKPKSLKHKGDRLKEDTGARLKHFNGPTTSKSDFLDHKRLAKFDHVTRVLNSDSPEVFIDGLPEYSEISPYAVGNRSVPILAKPPLPASRPSGMHLLTSSSRSDTMVQLSSKSRPLNCALIIEPHHQLIGRQSENDDKQSRMKKSSSWFERKSKKDSKSKKNLTVAESFSDEPTLKVRQKRSLSPVTVDTGDASVHVSPTQGRFGDNSELDSSGKLVQTSRLPRLNNETSDVGVTRLLAKQLQEEHTFGNGKVGRKGRISGHSSDTVVHGNSAITWKDRLFRSNRSDVGCGPEAEASTSADAGNKKLATTPTYGNGTTSDCRTFSEKASSKSL